MSKKIKSCVICAWRESCQKKFNLTESQINCPDFSEDIKIKKKKEENNEGENIRHNKRNR